VTASYKPSRRSDPFDRPLDAALERLRVHNLAYRPHHADVDRWIATCPLDGEEMTLHEPYVGSWVTVRCAGGCHEARIIAALAAEPQQPDQGLDRAEETSDIAWRALELAESLCR
jgi:hypothetical protein